jgi:putative salt-induced outer membrane protein YdiY
MFSRFLVLFVVAASAVLAQADQVTLKNGDRVTGTIVKSDGKSLVVKTELMGEVALPWASVENVTSTQPIHVALKDGRTLVGPVTGSQGNLSVATTNAGTVSAPQDALVTMRNATEQAAYEQSLHPRFGENWVAGANVGFALTRGNSQTKNLTLAFNANRATLHDKLALYANTLYATNDAAGATPSTTANAQQGGIRYDHDITPRVFSFVGADFQADGLQTLNLRSVLGGGLGFHAIKNANTTLDLLAGANYTHESYDAFSRNFAAATLGEDFMHKVSGSTVLTQSFYFYPNLTDAGPYRATFNLGTVTKISKWLGWQNSFGDIYVSNPPLGKKKNDILFSTGLNISLTH